LLLFPIAELQAQDFTYTKNNGTITITAYIGSGGAVDIPSTINGLPVTTIAPYPFNLATFTSITVPGSVTNIGSYAFSVTLTNFAMLDSVTSIGDWAFVGCPNLVSVSMGNRVTSIGAAAFAYCTGLTSVTIPDSVTNIANGVLTHAGGVGAFGFCTSLTNVALGKGVTNIPEYAFTYCTNLTSLPIGKNVTTIGGGAFVGCSGLTNVTMPASVTTISDSFLLFGGREGAFETCPNLVGVYFQGNAPSVGQGIFWGNPADPTTVYYLPGTTGWGLTLGGRPAVLWNPTVQTNDASFGVLQNRFGFNITSTPDIPLVVEASTNIAAGLWVPLQSCTLTNGSIYFSDAEWTNYASRLYRIRSP
jgi:BspA type Leucine rich repeat region (6 copies)